VEAVLGAFVSTIAAWFVLSLAVFVPADALLTLGGFYRLFWHDDSRKQRPPTTSRRLRRATPVMALIDSDSYRVDAYFEETKIPHLKSGARRRPVPAGTEQTRPARSDVGSAHVRTVAGRAAGPPTVTARPRGGGRILGAFDVPAISGSPFTSRRYSRGRRSFSVTVSSGLNFTQNQRIKFVIASAAGMVV